MDPSKASPNQPVPKQPEVWLRGPLDQIPALLQPAAHALLQANEELQENLKYFPDRLIWDRPAKVASVAFHLQHIVGILDRLFTYAEERALADSQLLYLKQEGIYAPEIRLSQLLHSLDQAIKQALTRLQHIAEAELASARYVGRQRIPSTTIGLLFHAAEHTMRHTGQTLVTAKILENMERQDPQT